MNKLWIPALATAALTLACSSQSDDSLKAANSSSGVSSSPGTQPTQITGKIAEKMDSGGYTYVLVDTGSEQVWAATREVSGVVGDAVVIETPLPMPNWHSKTLDRTFELVYFADSIHAPGELPAGHGSPEPPSSTSVDPSGIAKAEGGVTVEEIFRKRQDLIGTEITVRGKVVKYSENILGKNWLHIQDGTGAAGTNDLTITTNASVTVGNVVLVRGKLGADRDFGAGYAYELIIEDAAVTVE